MIYQENTAVILKGALRDAESESGLQGVARMEVEIKRAVKFLQISNDLRQLQRRADVSLSTNEIPSILTEENLQNEPKKSSGDRTVAKRSSSSVPRKFGQRVLCRYDGDGYYYSGTVQRSATNKSIVLFDMDIEQETFGHVLIPMNLNNLSNLFLQDCVLVQQSRATGEYWAPGLVLCLPAPFVLPGNLYKIQVFDPFARQVSLN